MCRTTWHRDGVQPQPASDDPASGQGASQAGRKVAGFVVLYAENTVEDPYASGHPPDFYDDCLPGPRSTPSSVSVRTTSGTARVPRVAADQGTSGVMRAITDAATPSRDAVEPGLQLAAGGEEPEPDPTPEVSAGQDDRYARFTEPPLGMFGKISDDPVADYLHAAGRYPLLSAAEEVHLAKAIEAGLYAAHLLETGDPPEWELLQRVSETGDFARQWMIVSNLRLVVHWAKRHTNRGLEFLDFDPGRHLGPDPCGGQVRLPARPQVLDLCHLVDPAIPDPHAGGREQLDPDAGALR